MTKKDTTTLVDGVIRACSLCGLKTMLYFCGKDFPDVCKVCYDAWYAKPMTPLKLKCKPADCRHGCECTMTAKDGNGLPVTRRTCQHCGRVERTIPSTVRPPKIPPLPTS